MATPPSGVPIMRQATADEKSWPRASNDRAEGGVRRMLTAPAAVTGRICAERNRLTSRPSPSMTMSRRSESSFSDRTGAPPAAASDTSSPPAQATWTRSVLAS